MKVQLEWGLLMKSKGGSRKLARPAVFRKHKSELEKGGFEAGGTGESRVGSPRLYGQPPGDSSLQTWQRQTVFK